MTILIEKSTEVSAKATRCRFSTAEKVGIPHATARETGGVTALLRREGIYSSHLAPSKKRGLVAVPRVLATRRSSSSSAAFVRPKRTAINTSTCELHGIEPSMRASLVAQLLTDLGVTKTHSRPQVSNATPFSEAAFKTLE